MKLDNLVYLSNPGIVTTLGNNIDDNIEKILSKTSGLTKDASFLNKQIYLGKISSPLEKIQNKDYTTRTNEILLTAILQINNEIQKAIKKYGKNKIGVVIGTTTTGIEENFAFFKAYSRNKKWDFNLYNDEKQSLSNPADFVKDFYSLSSVAYGISTACTSGAKALIAAKRLIENDICDAVICGGVDSINTLTINGFNSLGLLSSNISNPFSKNRDGINIGEGAGVFLASKDQISNIFLASGITNADAYHMTQPDESAKKPIEAIKKAIKKASIETVDYINLHATGTQANDLMEAKAFSETLPHVNASSTKPYMGHTLGAAGAIEIALCHDAIKNNILLPHSFDGNYDEKIDKITLIKNKLEAKVTSALSSSFAFGGDNAIVILRDSDEI